MTDKEVMQMALDTVQDARDYLDIVNTQAAEAKSRRLTKTLEALRTALAQGEQKPVAEIAAINECPIVYWDKSLPVGTKLYTATSKREWQGLTDAEISDTANAAPFASMVTADDYIYIIARAIETRLKEKNT